MAEIKTIVKAIRADLFENNEPQATSDLPDIDIDQLLPEEKTKLKKVLERRMKEAAKILDFEGAVYYRDYLKGIK